MAPGLLGRCLLHAPARERLTLWCGGDLQELAESIRRGISVAEEGGEHGVEEVGTGLDGQTGGEEAGGVSKEEEDA